MTLQHVTHPGRKTALTFTTDREVKAVKLGLDEHGDPQPDPTTWWDANLKGLGLRVRASGRKSWIVKKRPPDGSADIRRTLGTYPTISLTEARDAAHDEIRAIRKGHNRNAEGRQKRAAAKNAAARNTAAKANTGYGDGTFGKLAREYIAAGCPKKNKRNGAKLKRPGDTASIIERRILPVLGNHLLAEVERKHILKVTDAIPARHEQAANHAHRTIRRLFNYAIERGELKISPVAGMALPGAVYDRDRVLKDEELATLWAKAWTKMSYPFGLFHRLLLITGQRRGEVARMRWDDVDPDRAIEKDDEGKVIGGGPMWTIPKDFTKFGRRHDVPLSPLALDLLEEARRLAPPNQPWVFSMRGGKPIVGYGRAKLRADKLSGVTGWRLHDLRRTVATTMATTLGQPEAVVAAILNHSNKNRVGVTAAYIRSDYAVAKRHTLERWARWLDGLIRPRENVIPLRTAAGE